MDLKESVNYAIKHNPSVLASKKNLEAAHARLSQAFGAFLPKININGNYGKAYSQPQTMQIQGQVISFGTTETNTSKSLTASLTQPIFVPALFPGYNIALNQYNSASEDLRKAVQKTTYDVTAAYFSVLAGKRYVELQEETLKLAKSHLEQVESMLNTGFSTKADLLRAQVQVENSNLGLTKAHNAFDIAKNTFNNTLGRALEEPVDLKIELYPDFKVLPKYEDLIKTAFMYRPEWRQFLLGKKIAEDNLGLAQTGFLPNVTLAGQTGNNIVEYASFKSDANSWNVVGTASWTLFDGLTVANKVREAAAMLDAARANEDQTRNNIELEIKNAYYDLKSAKEALVSTKKAQEFADESYKVSDLRFTSGMGTNLEVIDAQVSLNTAKLNHLKALYDMETTKAKINKAVGFDIF